ncbi:Veg family protein [Fructilactobacillus ixorae]|uniref:Veg family protein n=2 Tax=Fructilactobacillus TaxID=2767881 RepID=A0ABY5BP54_9LACO|nr:MULTISPECIES: Veg family protein [Fructilactobacillus]USS84863.1 Veg family protein [Fructilactobacillus myrtifloralis]USS93530.1 Veg family protein [Fructilactobacillus ixorae]
MQMNLPDIRSWIQDHLGSDIKVVEQAGRKRTNEYDGVLVEVFPAVFIVDLDSSEQPAHASFTYTKILTKDIQVTFM